MRRLQILHPYCLRCFADLGDARGNAVHCPHCGFRNLASDRRTYWNRNPRLMQEQRDIQAGAAFSAAVLALGFFIVLPPASGAYAGFALAFPVGLGAIGWRAAEKMTRHLPGVHPASSFAGMFLSLGLGCAVLAIAGFVGPVVGASLAVAGIALALGVAYVGMRLARWKHRLMRGLDRSAPDTERAAGNAAASNRRTG